MRIDIRTHLRQHIRKRDPFGGDHLLHLGGGDLHILIIIQSLFDQIFQGLIGVKALPRDILHGRRIGRIRISLDPVRQVQLRTCVTLSDLAGRERQHRNDTHHGYHFFLLSDTFHPHLSLYLIDQDKEEGNQHDTYRNRHQHTEEHARTDTMAGS